ncbi:hypothetical protein KEM54_004649, partial [Ascosphaera aggregata]
MLDSSLNILHSRANGSSMPELDTAGISANPNKSTPSQTQTVASTLLRGEAQLPTFEQVSSFLHDRLTAFLAESHEDGSLLHRVQLQTRISMQVIIEALKRYPFEELALSYNGGKDCLVMVVLFLACLHGSKLRMKEDRDERDGREEEEKDEKDQHNDDNNEHKYPTAKESILSSSTEDILQRGSPPLKSDDGTASTSVSDTSDQRPQTHHHHYHDYHNQQQPPTSQSFPPQSIPAIYAQPAHPFPSVETFIHTSAKTYHLSIQTCPNNPPHTTLKSIFASYLESHPSIRAILVGTRRTDPYGEKLTHFARTDHGWPDFMRVHPVIDWRYAEIWAFIRHLGVEY